MAQRSRLGSQREVRPGVWVVTVASGRRKDKSRRTKSVTVYGTEDDASAARVRLAAEMGRSPSLGDSMTVGQYFWGIFVPRKEASRTRSTVDFYTSAYRSQIEETFGRMDVDTVPKSVIRTWAAGLPAQSAPNYVRALRAILRSAWDDGLIAEEPMRGRLELPSRDTRPGRVWTAEQASEALSRLRGADVEPLALVMVGAGLSASESRALSWGDLSPDCSEVTVEHAYTQRDGMKAPKNPRRYRTVPVLPVCAERLRELRGTGPLCLNRRGRRMGPGTVSKRWRELFRGPRCDMRTRKELPPDRLWGLPWIKMNRLRATHETLMLRAGVPDALNSAIHGHSQKVAYSHYLAPVSADAMGAAMAANGLVERRPALRFVD